MALRTFSYSDVFYFLFLFAVKQAHKVSFWSINLSPAGKQLDCLCCACITFYFFSSVALVKFSILFFFCCLLLFFSAKFATDW